MPNIQAVAEAIDQLFQANNWKFITMPDSTALRTAFRMNHPKLEDIRMLISFAGMKPDQTGSDDPCRGMRVIASCNIKSTKRRMGKAAEFLSRVNFGLFNGNFELDYTDGEVRYKTYLSCRDQVPSQAALEEAIRTPIFLFERYSTALMEVLDGSKTPEEAVQEAERQ